jgi:FlaA1/EpsC-like NDP-sugar epimerase
MKKKVVFVSIIYIIIGVVLFIYGRTQKTVVKEANEKIFKFKKYYQVLNQWIKNLINHYSLEQALLAKNYRNIAIYGYGEIGNRMYEELKGSEQIKVVCFIDQMAEKFTRYTPDGTVVYCANDAEQFNHADAVIVTTVNIFEEIREELADSGVTCDIVPLEDILQNSNN